MTSRILEIALAKTRVSQDEKVKEFVIRGTPAEILALVENGAYCDSEWWELVVKRCQEDMTKGIGGTNIWYFKLPKKLADMVTKAYYED
jgi:hypothetical protein